MNRGGTENVVVVACAWLPQALPAVTRAALRAQLPYGRQLRLGSAPLRQSHTLLGVAMACELLSRVARHPLRAAQLRYTPGGKPYAPGFPDFSISHAGNWVVCAVSSRGAIGIDVETLTSAHTRGALAAWSSREATLKAADASLGELSRVHGDGRYLRFRGRRWYGHAPRLTPGTVLRVVSSLPISSCRLLRRPAARVIARQQACR